MWGLLVRGSSPVWHTGGHDHLKGLAALGRSRRARLAGRRTPLAPRALGLLQLGPLLLRPLPLRAALRALLCAGQGVGVRQGVKGKGEG